MDGLRKWRKGTLKLLLLTGAMFTTTWTLHAATTPPSVSTPTNPNDETPRLQRSLVAEILAPWQERIDEFRADLARELLIASMTMIGGHGMTTPPPPPPPPKKATTPPTTTPPVTPPTPPPPPPPPPTPTGSGEGPGDPPIDPPPPNETPEPASVLTGLVGLATLAGYRFRRRRQNPQA